MVTLTEEQLRELKISLEYLHSDFEMLARGDWEPDHASCQASMGVVETIAEILKIELEVSYE